MEIAALLLLAAWCAALSVIDLRSRRLPDVLTLPGAAVIAIYGLAQGRWATAAVGALLLAVPYLLLHLCAPDALGAGDVKLALGLGAATALGGAQVWVWAALAAPVLTAAAGIGILLAHRAPGRETGPAPLASRAGPATASWLGGCWFARLERGGARVNPRTPAVGSSVSTTTLTSPREHEPSTALPRDSIGPGTPDGTVAHGPAMCVASLLALVVVP
ncbi:prepilin peptidase [Nocardia sp. 2]|uniref:Prepilin peptidase n=1 Tax=Nocardia acididurans TaxID=2802282 RepID=A0ABS1M7R0_9NOCA|nr:A24 family peptidase [Nocardia acididurans]MBL1076670.1 prepilin peptidase [Nocardia acididurans]